jgi:hypothetical protein
MENVLTEAALNRGLDGSASNTEGATAAAGGAGGTAAARL